jgi:hypothetical protein
MLAKIQEILNKNSDVKTLLEKIEPGTFGSSYVKSYESIVDFFNDIQLNENSLIQGAHMVYGWMPTILNITKYDLDTQNVLLSVENIGKEIDEANLIILIKFMNNSNVGASKLLHFIYPEKYPIWDSKICEIITDKSYPQKVQNTLNYINYCEAIQNLINELPENLKNFKREFEEIFKYKISNVRAAELMLFLSTD